MPEYGRWSSSQWNKEGLCLYAIAEEKEYVNKLNLFFKPSNLQLIQRLAQKIVKKLDVACHRNSENKIIKQNKNVLLGDLKQIHNKILQANKLLNLAYQ